MNFFDEIDNFNEDLISQFPGNGNSSSSSSSSTPCYDSSGECTACVDPCTNDFFPMLPRTGIRSFTWRSVVEYQTGARPSGYRPSCRCIPECYLEGEAFSSVQRYYAGFGIHWVNPNNSYNNIYNSQYARGSVIATGATLYINSNSCYETEPIDQSPIKKIEFFEKIWASTPLEQDRTITSNNFLASNFQAPYWRREREIAVPFNISLSNDIRPFYPHKFYTDYQSTLTFSVVISPNDSFQPFNQTSFMPIQITGALRDPALGKINQSINFNSQSQNYTF